MSYISTNLSSYQNIYFFENLTGTFELLRCLSSSTNLPSYRNIILLENQAGTFELLFIYNVSKLTHI